MDSRFYTDFFHGKEVLGQTWIYISIAGAGFALNTLIKFMTWFKILGGDFLNIYHFADLTQVIFLMAYIVGAYNSELILNSHRYAEEGIEIWKRILKA